MALGDKLGLKTIQEAQEMIPGILGAKDIATLANRIENQAITDIERVLVAQRAATAADLRDLVTHAGQQVDQRIATLKGEAAELLRADIQLAIDASMAKAQLLVDSTVQKTTAEARSLIEQLSGAISEQRAGIRRDLYLVLPLVAAVIGAMNVIGVLVAWKLFAR